MRRFVTAATACVLCLVGLVTDASAARAASLPRCNSTMPWGTTAGSRSIVVNMPVHNGRLDCILARGDTGAAVKALQTSLRYCHDRVDVVPDSVYGPITERAVAAVQNQPDYIAANGAPDGVYGPGTRRVMRWVDAATRVYCGAVR